MVEFQALIIYGNGKQAIYCEEKSPIPDKDGIVVQPILVAPSEELKEAYSLTDDDLTIETEDRKKAMWMEYPVEEMDWLSRSKRGAVLLIWCAFDRKDTPIMKKMEGLLDAIKRNDKERVILRARIFSLQEELEEVTSVQTEIFRKYKELTDAIGKKEAEGAEESYGG